jgi:ferredoxin
MRIVANREVCVGAGMCVLTSPELFDQHLEDGRVVILKEHVEGQDVAAAQQAVLLCPSGALSIVED